MFSLAPLPLDVCVHLGNRHRLFFFFLFYNGSFQYLEYPVPDSSGANVFSLSSLFTSFSAVTYYLAEVWTFQGICMDPA